MSGGLPGLPGLPGSHGARPDPADTARVRAAAYAVLGPQESDTTVMVTQLACSEPGCPPVETVIAVLRQGDPLQVKIHKPVAEIDAEDVRRALAGEEHEHH